MKAPLMNHSRFPRRIKRIILLLCGTGMLLAGLLAAGAIAQNNQRPVIIRDTEIETTLKTWSEPVIRAAELEPEAINIILVQNPNINAFVAGGPNIFLYTGLLQRAESPAEVIGVIAHELGHIRGGHLVRARGALETASYESLLGTILGIGAAVLTGEGGLAGAIIAGSQSSAVGRYLAFSRVQESSADQAALDYMKKAGMDPEGLVTFMQKLEDQELLPASQQSEYVRTHPLTRDRVAALEAGHDHSPHKGVAKPPEWAEQHRRMQAKLTGFISPEQVEWQYDTRDTSIAAEYARAIALYRQNRVDGSLEKIDALIAREPDNPYFTELKGQMLVDYGRVAAALPYYRRAVEARPDAALIRTAYAHALIESAGENNQSQLQEAIGHLERAVRDERRSTRIQRLLATAHGRLGQDALARLHLAEEALLKNDIPYARQQAGIALAGLEENSRPWLRAQDILNFIEQVKDN